MSSFLYKETNYTKKGKTVRGKSWNSYPQMITSIKHSLRLQETSKNLHIIVDKTKDNVIISDTDETLLFDYIKNKIDSNIVQYESITTEEADRQKLFKDFSNAKIAITKKIPLEIIEEELKSSNDEKEILKNVVYTHKVKNLKAKDKRTLKSLAKYIELKKLYDLEKQHKKYNNQVLLKEVLFKIPQGQTLNLNNDQWKNIINKFKATYFENYEMYFSAIHNDEGSEKEIKGHVHMFLSGFNSSTNDFDIKRNIFDKISKTHTLDLDFNDRESHKKVMNLFQQDFYYFFNTELSKMDIKERIELNEYQSIEQLNKRLKINQEDYLTINEKHEKLANKIIEDKFIEFDKNNPYSKVEFELNENTFSNSLSIKTNIENKGNNNRVNLFSKMLAISQHFSAYIQKLTDKIKELTKELLNKDDELQQLKYLIKLEDQNKQHNLKMIENSLKEKFQEEKKRDLETLSTYKDEIINEITLSKDKEIKNLENKNDLLSDMKMRYSKFEKVFNMDISLKLKEHNKDKKKDKKEVSMEYFERAM